jgi:hydroxylamine reductase (hybrid-cluster protein)
LGPKLPAFITPAILEVLVDMFAIRPNRSLADDLREFAA